MYVVQAEGQLSHFVGTRSLSKLLAANSLLFPHALLPLRGTAMLRDAMHSTRYDGIHSTFGAIGLNVSLATVRTRKVRAVLRDWGHG